jgi:hypothetical protein
LPSFIMDVHRLITWCLVGFLFQPPTWKCH